MSHNLTRKFFQNPHTWPQTHNNIECGTWSLPVKEGVILDFQEYIVQSKCGLIGWIIRMQRMAYWVLVVYNPLYKLNNQSLGHSLSQVGSTHGQEIDGKMDQNFRRSFPLSSTACCKDLYHTTAPVTGSWSWSWVVAEQSASVAVAEDASVRTISSPQSIAAATGLRAQVGQRRKEVLATHITHRNPAKHPEVVWLQQKTSDINRITQNI